MQLCHLGTEMVTRAILGPADVSDAELEAMVADSLGVQDAELLASCAEVAEYDLEALTTAGRYWVRGTARHSTGVSPYTFFVKVVQSWGRSRVFRFVPQELRQIALGSVPWRSEPLIYRSDLGERLPVGLTLPRAHAVIDLDEYSVALWLEAVDVEPVRWDVGRYAHAARLLGRLAASAAVRPLASLGKQDVVRSYAGGRLEHQVLPALRDEALWRHPLVAQSFDAGLRDRIMAAVDALPGVLGELDQMALGASHGDACTRNLLVARGAPDAFVLIDFAFWGRGQLGFDLTQLLFGEVQMGERPAAELPELERICLEAYVCGVREEGCDVPLERVRRAHALLMLLFSALSAVPFEHLAEPTTPEVVRIAKERAVGAAFVLDLVESTGKI
jgi:hypothetical protein